MNVGDIKAINDLIPKMIKDREIAVEDINATRLCLATLFLGGNKRKVKKVANCRGFNSYWGNLEKSGYFNEKGEVYIDVEKNDIEFIMMVLVAQGKLEAKRVKEVS